MGAPGLEAPRVPMTSTNRPTRRRAPRLRMDLPARLRGRQARSASILELSATGCLVRCEGRLVNGAIHDLEIDLGDGDATPLLAKVRVADASIDGTSQQVEGTLAGLEFLGLPAVEGARLRSFLDHERRRRQRADAPAR
jgi:PilZ domain-containing protein